MMVRVGEVVRTPCRDCRSAGCHCLVVCNRTLGSRDLRTRGTTNSTRSSLNPSSPHHCAAVGPNNAASRPSDIAAARSRSSHVTGVARCRKTRSARGTHNPSSSRLHHCCELTPHAVTSSRVTRSCCDRATSISSRSAFTHQRSDVDNAEAEPRRWLSRHDRRGDGQGVTTPEARGVGGGVSEGLRAGRWPGVRRTRRRRRRNARACRRGEAVLRV